MEVVPAINEVGMATVFLLQTFRFTVVQASVIFYDTPASIDKAEKLIAESASNESQLIVFPEAFIGGYPRGCDFDVVIGNHSTKGRNEFQKYCSTAIDASGCVDSLVGDRLVGDFVDSGALRGAEMYCTQTVDARDVWKSSMIHIAHEGGCFVLSANPFCHRKDYPSPLDYVFGAGSEKPSPDSVVCASSSVIISPSGSVLAGANYERESLNSADLDFGEIASSKFDSDVVGHYARPGILSSSVKDRPIVS